LGTGAALAEAPLAGAALAGAAFLAAGFAAAVEKIKLYTMHKQ